MLSISRKSAECMLHTHWFELKVTHRYQRSPERFDTADAILQE